MSSCGAPSSSSSETFREQLQQIRKTAAARFLALRAESQLHRRTKHTPYSRESVPGLREALMLNACRYAASCAWRTAHWRNTRTNTTQQPLTLGKGAPKTGIWAMRKARCIALHESPTPPVSKHHSLPRPASTPRPACEPRHHPPPPTSAIPADVRRLRASKFACALLARRAPSVMTSAATGGGGGGGGADAAAVRMRYAGRPDELYRRRMARRFAAVRRRRAEEQAERARVLCAAEREMRRRRGPDLLRSHRPPADPSLAPFLFHRPHCAFAFSPRFSRAPARRSAMLLKYSAPLPRPPAPDVHPLHRARQRAETKGLFHSRVMNRFT